jgi:two-component system, chemotaxis family, CheB/CheR fusion protein
MPTNPGRVLVVDDNRDAADSLVLILGQMGHEVRVCYEGQGALDAARALRPDVVFLDLVMPGMDGYEVARQLRALPECDGARLIALTGYGQPEDLEQSRAAGFDEHLLKPVEPANLLAMIGE